MKIIVQSKRKMSQKERLALTISIGKEVDVENQKIEQKEARKELH